MTKETTLQTVFFYGLFMDPDVLRNKGFNPTNFRLARVDGFGLRIGDKATLEPSQAEEVYGSVMDLSPEELELLYSGDGVEDYLPVEVTADGLDGNRYDAVAYILPISLLSGRNPDYAVALLAVAKKLGLPSSHLTTIREITL